MKHSLAIALSLLALSACGDEPAAPPAASPETPAVSSTPAPAPTVTPTVEAEMPLPTDEELANVPIAVQQAVEDITPENADGVLEELEMFIGADAMYYADKPGPEATGGGDGG